MSGKFSENVPLNQQVNFKCNSHGNCCRELIGNLEFYDIAKIIDNRPDLKINDFVDYIDEDDDFPYGIKGNLFGKQIPVLKKKKGACVFLDNNNRCSIHAFKPIACKIWPFKLENGQAVWDNFHKFLNSKCGYTLEEKPGKKEEVMKALLENEEISKSFFPEMININNLQRKEYISNLATCLAENIDFRNNSNIYELSSLDSSLIKQLEGNKEYYNKFYVSEKDLLDTNSYEKFSHLVFTHVLENVRNPNEFIQQLFLRVNVKQPVIFIIKNSLNALFIKLLMRPVGISYKYIENPGKKELNYFSLKSLKKLFSENGFFIKDILKYHQGYSPGLELFSELFSKSIENTSGTAILEDYEKEKYNFSYMLIAYKMEN